MAPDEYFDAIGDVLAYILSAEDFIYGQHVVANGNYFTIRRQNTELRFYAPTDKRYFQLVYRFSLTDRFIRIYEGDNELLRKHMEKYDVEDHLHDDQLNSIVAFERVSSLTKDEAKRALSDMGSHVFHSDCRIKSLRRNDPRATEDEEQSEEEVRDTWDGMRAIGLLYPYEEDFKPRDYENVAQQVISVGTQMEEQLIKKLGFGMS